MLRAIFAFILLHASPTVSSGETTQTPDDVKSSITSIVLFAITPSGEGKVVRCALDGVSDIDGNEQTFKPSATFIAEACKLFANGNWTVHRGSANAILPDYYFCYYSRSIPDHPICDVKFQSGVSD